MGCALELKRAYTTLKSFRYNDLDGEGPLFLDGSQAWFRFGAFLVTISSFGLQLERFVAKTRPGQASESGASIGLKCEWGKEAEETLTVLGTKMEFNC